MTLIMRDKWDNVFHDKDFQIPSSFQYREVIGTVQHVMDQIVSSSAILLLHLGSVMDRLRQQIRFIPQYALEKQSII